jgi:hypothetical protein
MLCLVRGYYAPDKVNLVANFGLVRAAVNHPVKVIKVLLECWHNIVYKSQKLNTMFQNGTLCRPAGAKPNCGWRGLWPKFSFKLTHNRKTRTSAVCLRSSIASTQLTRCLA